ncbi:tetratricopeptide repeat protein, partial [Dolichospermum circinale CS-545/17]|nr:tetratricopeptide repeat protein [Dolichospermum circinale CS-545/17]
GMYEQIIHSIELLIHNIKIKLEPSYTLSRLHNLLGDIYNQIGKIQLSIKYHEKSQQIALKCLKKIKLTTPDSSWLLFRLKMMEFLGYFNKGLSYMYLYEIPNSILLFRQCYPIIDNFQSLSIFSIQVKFCLALLLSESLYDQKSYLLAEEVLLQFEKADSNAWGRGYGFLFLGKTYTNLGVPETAFVLYQKALEFSTISKYTQVEAKALTGLAELYRIENEIKTALTYHQESIEILEKIGAKCDLAEAYFQIALTYQKMGNKASSEEYFNKALYLWSPEQIDAPKQIERVLNAMNS